MHSLIVHDIRPRPVQSGRLICAVEVYHQVIFGCYFSRTPVEINHNLVIPVHEVHLETFDAHLRIMAAYVFHISVESPISCPQNQTHTTLSCISAKHRKVNFRDNLHKVSFLVHSPALIENDIFDSMGSREVNVVLVCVVVDARTEIHAVEIPGVPPIPSHLARTHPAVVFCRIGRRSKKPHEVIDSQMGIVVSYHNNSPRKCFIVRAFRDIIFSCFDYPLQHIVIALLDFLRIRSETAIERRSISLIVKEHSRIVPQIRLRHEDFHAVVSLHGHRQKCKALLVPLGESMMFISIFK